MKKNLVFNPFVHLFFYKARISGPDHHHKNTIVNKQNVFLFFLCPLKADLEILQMLKEALIGAEPIRAELDRGLKVLLPSQVQKTIALPPDFFALSPEELKKEQQLK